MEKKAGVNDSSLGILNMDNFKVFGEVSANCSSLNNANKSRGGGGGGGREVNERLHAARLKANEMLNKSKQRDLFVKPGNVENKENRATAYTLNNSPKLDKTDYVQFTQHKINNVSDFVIDHSIPLELSGAGPSNPPSAAKTDAKISFVPAEFTGRSTGAASLQLTVGEILASSFAPKARNLCETLQHNADVTLESMPADDEVGVCHRTTSSAQSSSSSSFATSFNASHSLPRTADMSRSKAATCSELSFNGCSGGFSFTAGHQHNDSDFQVQADFAPGELMQSKLLNDEIAWAQQYAAIPTAALSVEAKAIVSRTSALNVFDSPLSSNSMIANDPNFSVGNFFNMRSENLSNIVGLSKSPPQCRTPTGRMYETRDDTVSTTTSTTTGAESKDSGNATENNSYMLSMSAIDRALCNLDLQTDSDTGLIGRILQHGTKNKSNGGKSTTDHPRKDAVTNERDDDDVEKQTQPPLANSHKTKKDLDSLLDSQNKENLDPQAFADTISFTESLLNSSEMRQFQRSPRADQSRSPLSPIAIAAISQLPKIKISLHQSKEGDRREEYNDADIDEWPSTPAISPNRRVRRTKSPLQKSREVDATGTVSSDESTPVNRGRTRSPAGTATTGSRPAAKSLCSTRLDNGTSTSRYDFGISPNLSNKSVAQVRNNNSNDITLTAAGIVDSGNNSPAAAPYAVTSFNLSPRSFNGAASNASSPGGFRSPHLDSTTNSERRFLNAAGVRKANTSPITSESQSKHVVGSSVVSLRSSSSHATTVGATTVRSISRCSSSHSNSSEFSHRDGKAIPLKVTTMEMCWGTTKLRKDSHKSMQVKNHSHKRLIARIEIHGPGFQLVNAARTSTLTLQSQECRSIIVNFCPTVLGSACGTLDFYSPQTSSTTNSGAAANHATAPFLTVPLYGYGGHACLILQNILKGPVGSAFLPMGDLCDLVSSSSTDPPLQRTFTLHNNGPLQGFMLACIDSVGLTLTSLCDAFEVQPHAMLIPPWGVATVRIIFRPRREHLKKILKRISHVLTLANLRITCGDEANRQRMRRLVWRMSREERAKISTNTLDKLWHPFPEEVEIPELSLFKEPPSTALDLLCGMRVHEIALTLNHERLDESAAETSSLFFPNADETVLFRTICCGGAGSPTPVLDAVEEEIFESSMLSSAAAGAAAAAYDERAVSSSSTRGESADSWSVSPKALELNFKRNLLSSSPQDVSFFVRNSFKSRQYFEVACTPKGWLRFTPSEGYVEPDGGQLEVKVHATERTELQLPKEQLKIMVYMENECISLPVHITRDNQ